MSVRIEDTIVEELAARFWSLARALDRLDRLESAQEFRGWLDRLGQDERHFEELSRTLVLHALGAALDPVNLRVLAHLCPDEPVSLADLSARCALGRVPLHLRLGILVQAGLAALELEKEAARDDARRRPGEMAGRARGRPQSRGRRAAERGRRTWGRVMVVLPCPYCDYRGRRSDVHAHLAEVHAGEIAWGVHERTGDIYAAVTCPFCGARWEQVLRKACRNPSFVDEFNYEISLVVFHMLLHHLRGEHGIGE